MKKISRELSIPLSRASVVAQGARGLAALPPIFVSHPLHPFVCVIVVVVPLRTTMAITPYMIVHYITSLSREPSPYLHYKGSELRHYHGCARSS